MPATYKTPGTTPGRTPATGAGQRPSRRRIAGERRPQSTSTAEPATRSGRTSRAQPSTRDTTVRPQSRQARPQSRQAAQAPPERAGRGLLAVAAVLLVAVAAMAALVVRDQFQAAAAADRAEALDSALSEAPPRAEKAASALLSYSHDSIDAAIKRATPFLTKEYAEEYTTTMREVVAGPAEQTKATVTAKVLTSGVVDAGPQRTDVLVFVDQVTESTNSDQPSTALNRAILTMVKRDGQWVVSDLKGL